MDDNSADEEIKDENLSPQQGGKKLKLNDGSSQDSLKDLGSSIKDEKDENVDSGISADKSESTSSDDRAVGATSWADGPSNEVIHAAPSSSNVRAILLQIKRPKKGNRNYRKRKNTPDKEHDSDTSVQDSDDLSDEEETTGQTNEERRNSDEDNRSMDETTSVPSNMFAESDDESLSSNSISSTSSHNSDDSNESFDSSDLVRLQNIDSDSDEAPTEQDENQTPPSVLLKIRPKHNWFIVQELMKRELGLTFPCGKAAKNDVIFEHKYYGSLHAVYRLELMYKLNKHRGCVNSINFNPEGYLLASGSDDTNVIVWDWATDTALQSIKTGHKSNVFQSKFLYLNARSQLNIVTCARDGQVRLLQCPPSGGAAVSRRRLISHSKAAHKLYVSPSEPHLVISAGEDGLVMQADVRTDRPNRVFWVKDKGSTIPLYSVHGHPLEPRELAVAGRDRFVRIYDRRKSNKPINMYCPSFFHETVAKKKWAMPSLYITCAIYNHDGSEILASYSDDDIYLFDVKNDCHEPSSSKDGFTHRYSGHRNSATFKGVAFFGPRSQFVVSGSDCSNIYVWDKHSEAIVQWMCGDEGGVVNCIESHPRCPVLATSGLDKDVKIWVPSKETDPEYKGLERVVKENASSQLHSPLFNDFLPSLYSAWRGENRLFSDDDGAPPAYGGIEFDGNVCTTF